MGELAPSATGARCTGITEAASFALQDRYQLGLQAYLASSQHVLYPSLFNFISGLAPWLLVADLYQQVHDLWQDTGVTSFAVLQLTDAHLVGSHMLPFSSWDVGAVATRPQHTADLPEDSRRVNMC